jgi:hypothetical protein
MKILFAIFLLSTFLGCEEKDSMPESKKKLELRFLDSYVIPAGTMFENTEIGGLSGIDYNGSEYYLICDQTTNPRFYKADISIENKQIDTLIFTQVVELDDENVPFFKQNRLDMEGIRFDGKNLIVSSEGAINSGKNPAVFEITPEGKFVSAYDLPAYFNAKNPNHPRNNGVFEGISESWGKKGIWVSTELPLLKDGPAPQPERTVSPVRITYFDKQTQSAEKQFAYLLEPVAKPPLLLFYINGASEILSIEKDRFLVLERGFSAGYGMKGNTIRIFEVDVSKATNTLELDSLKGKEIAFAEKRLLFDFESVREQLPDGVIDNIEGICFGPELQNGNKSLILVADNNFNSLGPQLNQVVLLELLGY